MDNLFGWSNGSSDESDIKITGFELFRLFKYMKSKIFFILLIFLNFFDSTFIQINIIIQGKLATILVNSEYDTAEDFLESINNISTIIIIVFITRFITNMFDSYLQSFHMTALKKDMHVKVLSKVLDQDITYFDDTLTGVIISRIDDDISNACEAFTDTFFDCIYCFYDFLLGLISCLFQSWKVSLISLCCFPVYALCELIGNKYANRLFVKYNDRRTNAASKAEEIFTCFRTVRPFDAELREYHEYRKRLFDVHEIIMKTSLVRGVQNGIESLTHWGVTSFILFYTGICAVDGKISPGSIVSIMSILDRWQYTITGTFDCFYSLRKSNVSAAKILEIIDRKPLIGHDEGADINGRIKGIIEFKNVSFKYRSRDEFALKNLSFKVNPGETVALIGESGCGKSTTLQLIQRFYDINEGQILIDGKNISELKPSSIRSQISIVQQTPAIFSMSVKDNIRYGKPHAPREEVINSSIIANAHSFIVRLKEGYKTMINQNSLSGGQKQRICIARAVMMNSPVILLDEATAALDTESEKLVQEAITKIKNEKEITVIVVAHRLATVKNATRILVMDKGQIIEEGTHEELLLKSGAYARLIQNQLI